MNLLKITTETRNPATRDIDRVSTLKMVQMIAKEDASVAAVVAAEAPRVAKAVDTGYRAIQMGGRIIYFGAGTSGRLGVLDASEILPTFGVANLFVGLIAGGDKALRTPVENAEDNAELIALDFAKIKVTNLDFLVGITASGRTPYVMAGLKYGHKIGATTAVISTAKNPLVAQQADISIVAVTGAEPITGSTRMKSGTAQKMILNQLSTGIMVKLGKTYSNLMIDLIPTNAKLVARAQQLIMLVGGVDKKTAHQIFEAANHSVKVALVMLRTGVSATAAQKLILKQNGKIRNIIDAE